MSPGKVKIGAKTLELSFLDINQSHLDVIRESSGKALSDEELRLFIATADRKKLDPLKRQIYAIVRPAKGGGSYMNIMTAIDGLRAVAARTGSYAGKDSPVFSDPTDATQSCSVTVYKIVQGQRVPFQEIAFWDEYYPKGQPSQKMWDSMPRSQLAKCCEARALRAAFPEDLGGLYITDEMHQADGTKIEPAKSKAAALNDKFLKKGKV